MVTDRVFRLGAMVDEWCLIPRGEPAIAKVVEREFDVLVEVPELSVDWFGHRLGLRSDGPTWWCRWCPEELRRPAQYVVGGEEGTVSCAAHLPAAAEFERALIDETL